MSRQRERERERDRERRRRNQGETMVLDTTSRMMRACLPFLAAFGQMACDCGPTAEKLREMYPDCRARENYDFLGLLTRILTALCTAHHPVRERDRERDTYVRMHTMIV